MEATQELPGQDPVSSAVGGVNGEGGVGEGDDIDAPATQTESAYVDHPHLCLAGSDITLLSAVDNETKKRTRYKLHKNILSAYSSVMKDMLESSSDDGKPDGEPAEVILEDHASTLTHLVSFFYGNEDGVVVPTWGGSLDSNVSAGLDLLTLADKYGIMSLQKMLEWAVR